MTKKELALAAVEELEKVYPDAVCSLTYEKPYELLISTRLSAQCTDARVNIVTEELFIRFVRKFQIPKQRRLAADGLVKLAVQHRIDAAQPHSEPPVKPAGKEVHILRFQRDSPKAAFFSPAGRPLHQGSADSPPPEGGRHADILHKHVPVPVRPKDDLSGAGFPLIIQKNRAVRAVDVKGIVPFFVGIAFRPGGVKQFLPVSPLPFR